MRKNSRTFVALFYWIKLLGFNPWKLSKDDELEYSYFGLVYGCLLSAFSSYVFYRIIIERSKMVLPGDSPIAKIADIIGILSAYFENTLMWMSFSCFQNRVKLIVESFLKAWRISVKLGIPDDSEKRLKHLGLSLLIFNCLYVIVMIFNNSNTKNYRDVHIYLWIIFAVIEMSTFNMVTIFLWSFVTVKQKFRELNDKVRFVIRNASYDEEDPRLRRDSSQRTILISERVKTISELHRQLRDVIDRIQERYGGIVVLNIISELTTLTIDVHIGYRFLKRHSGPITVQDISYIFIILLWIWFPILVLTLLSNVCGSLSDEANDTGNILHATLNDRDNFDHTDTAANIHLLSMELLQNRVKISLLGCLDLDQFFVYSIMGTATTYLTIMLQFYN